VVDDQTIKAVGRGIAVSHQLTEVIQDLIPVVVVREVVADLPEVGEGKIRPGSFKNLSPKLRCRRYSGHPWASAGRDLHP
jgi:hypothetical protein